MSGGHILVVDDEPSMRRYLQTALELDSYEVRAAATGEDALEKVQQRHPDLVLLDLIMPGWDGLETLQRIRKVSPSSKVVMISCVRDTRKVAQAMRLGAQDYLSKPIQKEEMDEVLRFCLQHSARHASDDAGSVDLGGGVMFFAATQQMQALHSQAVQVAPFDFPVLLLGESGTGKEVLAQLIHKYSQRSNRTFLKVNCAAVPNELLESELFGYEPGAFTGANKRKPGKFELCNNGTLLLDEIGEMSPALQAKLLQVLQDGQFCRLGARSSVKVNVRVLAATNINMAQAIAERSFREDLYYRLSSFVLRMPSLRQRKEEIPMMLRHFILRLAERYACPILPLSPRLLHACENYSWPGNIRQLENFVKRYLVLGDEESAIREMEEGTDYPRPASVMNETKEPDLRQIVHTVKSGAEIEAISNALEKTAWNRKRAAMMLNIAIKPFSTRFGNTIFIPAPSSSFLSTCLQKIALPSPAATLHLACN
jgi:DNA-binding NtrC family response regulator